MIIMLLPSSENMHNFFPCLITNVSWETWSNSEIIIECYRPLTELLRNIPKRKQRKINTEYRSLDKPNRQKEPGYIHITYVLKCCFLLLYAWWSPDLKMRHQIKWETSQQYHIIIRNPTNDILFLSSFVTVPPFFFSCIIYLINMLYLNGLKQPSMYNIYRF
jgi:hypothetical protein